MFDVGFQELILVAIVALVVIGPERLPKVARIAGKWVGHARRTLASVKQEIDRELKTEELRKVLDHQARLNPLETILEEPPKTTARSDMPSDGETRKPDSDKDRIRPDPPRGD
ncbi:Sec-independent protein translocase protein TatB [Thiocystis violacea]|uniref:Sec-independent protein translocase protein TatB n=1 Tax=Thiocystis violacea TaxID=13725 RepID=UPI001904513E|nr:Sec-independent protein translocase protein TatB [Thiocystis violacea]MBK1717110.1 twin-arginine translocase subunit TatB [Thiocystis violacea]